MRTPLLALGLALAAGPALADGPAASLAARPAWDAGRGFTQYARSTSGYAPVLADAAALFARMPAEPAQAGALSGALLVCRLSTSDRTADTFSMPDLHVRLRAGSGPEVADDGPEDDPVAYLTAPLVELRPGQPLQFEVWDRDVTEIEFIGRGKGSYAGTVPFVLRGPKVEAECRAWGREQVEAELVERLGRADAALAALARAVEAPPDVERLPSWGLDPGATRAADAALRSVAGLAGWAEPRLVERVAARERSHARWAERVKAAAEVVAREASPLTSPQPLGHAEVTRVTGGCGPSGLAAAKPWGRRPRSGGCALEVELHFDLAGVYVADDGLARAERGAALPTLYVLDPRGTARPVRPVALRGPEASKLRRLELAAGQPLRVLFASVPEDPPIEGGAGAAALVGGGGPALVVPLPSGGALPGAAGVPSP